MTSQSRRSAAPAVVDRSIREIAQARSAGFPFYVYTLSDADGVFYVGKGTKGRMFHHVAGNDRDANHRKKHRIAQAGPHLQRTVVAYFMDDSAAFAHEAVLIAERAQELTNIAQGVADPRQRCIDEAAYMLSRIQPFEKTRLASHPKGRMIYDSLVSEITSQVTDPCPRYITIHARSKVMSYGW